ncbi:unnamed protein product [Pieris macdunnoughi]|uniref:Uncharacterized protein n=1 Tax=Pieris macdunnoughi TaxID=345717 RepID=A0A821N1L9_9NEOP|nr:unnamed protein product [Pieris macdunnoughi]
MRPGATGRPAPTPSARRAHLPSLSPSQHAELATCAPRTPHACSRFRQFPITCFRTAAFPSKLWWAADAVLRRAGRPPGGPRHAVPAAGWVRVLRNAVYLLPAAVPATSTSSALTHPAARRLPDTVLRPCR